MKREALNAWILAEKAAGRWVQPCPSCGAWFSLPRKGRRAIICPLKRCWLWLTYQTRYGRAPPAWLVQKWKEQRGNELSNRRAPPPSLKSKPQEAA